VGLVVIRAKVIIVPFLTSFMLHAVSFLAPIFNPVTCISVVDYITQVSFLPIWVMLLRGSDAAGRVPTRALAVVRVLTSLLSLRSRVGSTIVDATSIAWKSLTYALISSLSLGSKSVSWSIIIQEAKALSAGVW
jgi:hypothetical protein